MKATLLGVLLVLSSCDSGARETAAPVEEPSGAENEAVAEDETEDEAEAERPAAAGEVGAATDADTAAFAASTRAFAADLWQQLRARQGNVAVSPASISVALAMTWGGARGETAAQMARTLHFGDDAQAIHRAAHAQIASWNAERDTYTLRVANRLFAQDALPLLPDFVTLTRDSYGAPIEALDFAANPDAARVHINEWVEDQTNDRIQDLIPPRGITPDTRLVLTNAMYFHGSWRTQFPEDGTEDAPFHLSGGADASVPMMRLTGERFGYAEVGAVRVLELPYVGDELSMVVVLPTAEDGLAAVEQGLSAEQLAAWTSAPREQPVDVFLPRFRIDPPQSIALKDTLQAMGMVLPFLRGEADFTGITDPPQIADRLHIGQVFHKAFVEVNEEGTEAAAATAVVMARGGGPPPSAGPPVFRADHPFLFLLRDVRSGAILFMGRVADPRAAQE